MGESGRSKGVRDVKKRAAATTGLSKGAAAREVENIEIDHVSPEHHQELVQMDEVVVEQAEGELFSAKLGYKMTLLNLSWTISPSHTRFYASTSCSSFHLSTHGHDASKCIGDDGRTGQTMGGEIASARASFCAADQGSGRPFRAENPLVGRDHTRRLDDVKLCSCIHFNRRHADNITWETPRKRGGPVRSGSHANPWCRT